MAAFELLKRLMSGAGATERRHEERLRAPIGLRVLVVDDSPTIRAVLGKMLLQDGYEVTKAGDGEEALALARTQQPGLIFLDVVLPGMSGFAALRALRRDPLTHQIPIVMMSGNLQATEQFYVQRFGADDFMKKPFGRAEVFERVRELVESGRLPKRLEYVPTPTVPHGISEEEWNAIPDVAMPDAGPGAHGAHAHVAGVGAPAAYTVHSPTPPVAPEAPAAPAAAPLWPSVPTAPAAEASHGAIHAAHSATEAAAPMLAADAAVTSPAVAAAAPDPTHPAQAEPAPAAIALATAPVDVASVVDVSPEQPVVAVETASVAVDAAAAPVPDAALTSVPEPVVQLEASTPEEPAVSPVVAEPVALAPADETTITESNALIVADAEVDAGTGDEPAAPPMPQAKSHEIVELASPANTVSMPVVADGDEATAQPDPIEAATEPVVPTAAVVAAVAASEPAADAVPEPVSQPDPAPLLLVPLVLPLFAAPRDLEASAAPVASPVPRSGAVGMTGGVVMPLRLATPLPRVASAPNVASVAPPVPQVLQHKVP